MEPPASVSGGAIGLAPAYFEAAISQAPPFVTL
jgi:hypothetical protein